MLEMVSMLLIVVGVFALGDFCGVITKARLSSVFVALITMLILFMTGLVPVDIIKKAGLSEIARWGSPILVFSMGTMINVKQLANEWRTVLMSLISMLVVVVVVLAVIPIIGKDVAIVAIPIINGGIIATNIMTTAAMDKGLETAAAAGALFYAVQKFVGTVPASYFGLKEAHLIVDEFRKGNSQGLLEKANKEEEEKNAVETFFTKHKTYYTPFMCFGIAAFGAYIAVFLQSVTGLHNSILALILGVIAGGLGLVPTNILEHGKSSGFITMTVFAAIIPSLAKIEFVDLLGMGGTLAITFAAVLLGVYVLIYLLPTWKLVGSRNLAFGIAMAQLMGFPATYLVANEIATAVSENEDEYKVIMAKLGPAYVVSGMASVTTLSIVIAGIMVNYL